MKKAVIYGAGNIGRGFIGKALSESGYQVCFIEIDQAVVDQLNRDRQYPVVVVWGESRKVELVKNVRAVNGVDASLVEDEIAQADLMATAVGVNALPHIINTLCRGLRKRFSEGRPPLDILICENLIDADRYLRRLIDHEMGGDEQASLDRLVGLVEASIGRMVPVMTDEMRQDNALTVWVEPYEELPVDKDAFKGPIPAIKGLVPFSPFGYYIKRKLYIHNMSHALCAYLGWQKDYTFIYQCVADEVIRQVAQQAMSQVARALNREFQVELAEIHAHVDDLLERFANAALGDTVDRVGKDPLRKLGNKDRLIGAALYCQSQGFDNRALVKGIIAALRFDNPRDESAVRMQEQIRQQGILNFLLLHCGLEPDSPLLEEVLIKWSSE